MRKINVQFTQLLLYPQHKKKKRKKKNTRLFARMYTHRIQTHNPSIRPHFSYRYWFLLLLSLLLVFVYLRARIVLRVESTPPETYTNLHTHNVIICRVR